jgi:superfamily II DNA or RNA helicase
MGDQELLEWSGRTPRRWQTEALDAVMPRLVAGKRGVVSAIMGSGKSLLIAEIVARWIASHPDDSVVVTTPTVALVNQLAETLRQRLGRDHVALRYTDACERPAASTLACVPSCANLAQDLDILGQNPGLWICDEAHRTETPTIRAAFEACHPGAVLGVTATPFLRESWRSLSLFDELWYKLDVQAALSDGIIVRWRVETLESEVQGEVALRNNLACAHLIRERTSGFFGICNAISIEDAEHFAAFLSEHGVPAEPIHSRLSRREIRARIDGLAAGVGLACLVHVNMLSEGVDLPFLEWICLRRPPRSRVAAVQELGRVIRAFPGKREAIILDPRDQMAEFSMSYEAAIGGEIEEEEERKKASRREVVTPAQLCGADPTEALEACQRWLRAASRDLEFAGRLEDRVWHGGSWRRHPPTPKQIDHLGRMSWVATTLPERPRQWVQLCLDRAGSLRRGDCSDLIEVVHAVKPAAGGWLSGQLECDEITKRRRRA